VKFIVVTALAVCLAGPALAKDYCDTQFGQFMHAKIWASNTLTARFRLKEDTLEQRRLVDEWHEFNVRADSAQATMSQAIKDAMHAEYLGKRFDCNAVLVDAVRYMLLGD
jgi:hypothetical protein